MLSVRRLSIKLIEKLDEWKRLRKKNFATFFIDPEEPPAKPVGLRSSTAVCLVKSTQPTTSPKEKTKNSECILCHLQKNEISVSFGLLFRKFLTLYISEFVFFTPL